MRTIAKDPNPPGCLAQQPAGQDWYSFMQTPCHSEVAESLFEEQQFLCCYCESSISGNDGHVEHMAPRKAAPALAYSYENLAASCNGGKIEHCGHFKDNPHKNPDFSYDANQFAPPHDLNTDQLFDYLPNGQIVPAPSDTVRAEYMIGYLGLDCPRLRGRRRAHAQALVEILGVAPDQELISWARSFYLEPDADNHLQPYHSLSRTLLNA